MISGNVFPGGKRNVVTFSYDDGKPNDVKLAGLFNDYNVKATFHLNGENYIDMTDSELKEVSKIYKGHEIACHTLHHGFPANLQAQTVVSETMKDREILEKIAGYPVFGMSYPFGDYSDTVINAMRMCGIVYSRTVKNTNGFKLPKNFMEWHPTCHHSNALSLCDNFDDSLLHPWRGPLFYIWGHSYEFGNDRWDIIERILDRVAGNEKVWYATNIEIQRYLAAQKLLRISVDEKILENPTNIDLWVEKDKRDIIFIPAGETVRL